MKQPDGIEKNNKFQNCLKLYNNCFGFQSGLGLDQFRRLRPQSTYNKI
jgi:hypothetical protein